MIVVDTNVLSETLRPRPDARVMHWLDGAPELVTTATVVQELVHGLALMPDGHRRRALDSAIAGIVDVDFAGRVLPYDIRAAIECGILMAARASRGRPIALADAQIGAVCIVNGAALATRNVDDFQGLGLTILNPWASE